MSEPPLSYSELAALVAEQAAQLAEQGVLIEALRVELEALRRQAGRDSSNSSQPPSTDGPAAKAKTKAARRPVDQQAQPSPDGQPSTAEPGRGRGRRRQGGQRGHRGSGLAPVAIPDRREPVEPACCAGCGENLAGAPGTVGARVQVFDLPSFSLAVTEYQMMRRRCGCGHTTTAGLPAGVRGGPTCYGPNVTAAATLLASQDVLGIERTADLMSALLGVAVSTGFVSSCLTRLDTALTTAEFEQALKQALRAQEVVGTDETPAPLTDAASSEPDCHNPHVYTVRTMRAYTGGGADLIWYGAAGDRTKASISGFGILDEFRGVLVRDDFGGYVSYDPDLAGVQQCLAHLLRYLDDAYAIDTDAQAWARQVADALRTAIHEVNTARAANRTVVDAGLLARLRRRYDNGVAVGISANLSRPWPKGNHPGLQLARRLKRKAHQVWLFATRFDVPPTNNGSESAIRGFKLAAKVQGCWRTLATLQRHCRIRSYLVSARSHGRRPTDAIRDALSANPWMPQVA
ncbi:MAG: IS66 family transposase [Actinomycetota bacterium]|nr:IS66 family transposase [Actinomycetota bacterium]